MVALNRASMVALSCCGTGSSATALPSAWPAAELAVANMVRGGRPGGAEQAGVGDVLHGGDRAAERGGVVLAGA